MCRLRLVSLVAVSLCLLGASAAQARPKRFTIRAGQFIVNQIGAFKPRSDATIGAAIRAFGRPSLQHLRRADWCVLKWRRLRLTINFMNFGGHALGETTCTASVGLANDFIVKSPRFETWGTVFVSAIRRP